MTLTASSISTNNTLEQLRNQFNNLVTDVEGLETGTKTFSALTATTTSSTFLNVLEDGNIVFEGATDDAFETTLTVADPTADRTITFPDSSGTVIVTGDGTLIFADGATIGTTSSTDTLTLAASGIVTFKDDIIIKDGGTIGSTSSTSAITIASSGIVTLADDLLIKDGGTIGVASSTSAITIASTGIVTFVDDIIIKDAGTIGSASDTDAISISSGGVVNISATTANTGTSDGALTVAGGVGIAADLSVGDDLRLISDGAILNFGADNDINITHVADTGLTTNGDFTVGDDLFISGGVIDLKTNGGSVAKIQMYCESSNAHFQTIQAAPHASASSAVLVLPVASGTLATTAVAADEATALAIALG